MGSNATIVRLVFIYHHYNTVEFLYTELTIQHNFEFVVGR